MPDALDALVKETATRLQGGTDAEGLASKYATRMVKGGDFHILLKRAKFEDVLLRLARSVDDEQRVGSLLSALFSCERGQFGENHSAIASLMGPGGPVKAFITTNYDDAIEQALERRNIDFDSFDHQSFRPDGIKHRPYVLKLHGDVRTGRYVFTTEHQYRATRERTFAYLESLLAGATVLVVGYSGLGDSDIAPHLLAAKARLIWVNNQPPAATAEWWESDLRFVDPNTNVLMKLSGVGPAFGEGDARQRWRQQVRVWAAGTERAAFRAFVSELLALGRGWPRLHLHHASFETVTPRAPLELRKSEPWLRGRACLGVSAYLTADQAFDASNPRPDERSEWNFWKGFIRWRLGRLREALDYLSRAAAGARDDHNEPLRADALRMYLEVAAQVIRQARGSERRLRLSLQLRVPEIRRQLADQRQTDYPGDFLTTFVHALHDVLLQSVKVRWAEVQEAVHLARDLHYWAIAEAGARLLVEADFRRIRVLLGIDWELARLGSWNTLRKSAATLIYVVTPLRPSFVLDFLDGHILGYQKARVIELRYRWNVRCWRRAFRPSVQPPVDGV